MKYQGQHRAIKFFFFESFNAKKFIGDFQTYLANRFIRFRKLNFCFENLCQMTYHARTILALEAELLKTIKIKC